jgi:hypothetical protein
VAEARNSGCILKIFLARCYASARFSIPKIPRPFGQKLCVEKSRTESLRNQNITPCDSRNGISHGVLQRKLSIDDWGIYDDHCLVPELADESFIPIAWAKRIPSLRYIDVQLGRESKDMQSWTIEREHERTAPAANVQVHVLNHAIATATRKSYGAAG